MIKPLFVALALSALSATGALACSYRMNLVNSDPAPAADVAQTAAPDSSALPQASDPPAVAIDDSSLSNHLTTE